MKTREIEDVIAELSMEEERDLKLVCSRIRSYYLGLLPEKELCDDCKAKNIGMFDGGYSDKQCPICRSKNEAIDEMKKRIGG